LLEGRNNVVATLQWNRKQGFYLDSFDANGFRDRYGFIHARRVHPLFYDAKLMKPSRAGIEYLTQIFTGAIGEDDTESIRLSLFALGNLLEPYQSVNTHVAKRIRFL
jgi:6-phosphofructokinase 1